MRRNRWLLVLSISAILATLLGAPGNAGSGAGGGHLDMYQATVDGAHLDALQTGGYDIATVEQTANGYHVELVLTPKERNDLKNQGFGLTLVKNKKGQTVSQQAAAQAVGGYNVYRPYDGPGGIADQLRQIAKKNPNIAQLQNLGTTRQGRPILAIRMTQGVKGRAVGSLPGILYQGTTHAREWISTEVTRRLLLWYIDQFPNNKTVHNILKTTELWFIPVVNPDGYQYTFDTERLWRKNLRDNDGDGVITSADGVDLNRNYPEHWNFDNEGSSSQFTSETYRGTAPGSEPEVKASINLFNRTQLKFAISYHSYGALLLYTQGWQVQTPSADDPVYVALTGTDDDPAIPGFNPGVGADLYTTNGEFTDWAHAQEGVLAWTPELEEGCDGCGFVFPDDEALVRAEFEKNLPFAFNVARSALDPDDPYSLAGVDTQAFYLDVSTIDPWKSHNPSSDLAVTMSYGGGSGQPVEVLAKRAAGAVTLKYKINGGSVHSAPTSESPNGERYGGNNAYDSYYHYLRGVVTGIAVGNSVEYWFTAGSGTSPHTTFQVVEDADAPVLVVAAEDRTGASPTYANQATPNYLSYYTDALTANGTAFDVYDVDAMGRTAPDALGVLSHYDAVIWYTGDDSVTREPGWTGGNASRLANDLQLEARAYLNEGGKLLYTGRSAGALWNGVFGTQLYDPVANQRCVGGDPEVAERCLVISDKNDFLQYYLGAYIYNFGAGTDPGTGEPFDVDGVSDPYTGATWSFDGPDSAQNQDSTASFLTTSSILKPAEYPQFTSNAPAVWDTGSGGAFEPFDGSKYLYSQQADVSYKRVARTITVPGGGATLSFRVSYDTEPSWDFVFVEAHTVGDDDWTTLPDLNGHTGTDTGESCAAGWEELHPWIVEHYQGADCSGVGSSGTWNASSGRSAGWEPWSVDLSAYAGDQVELSISYASDWGVQGLGSFLDSVEVSTGEGTTSFEDDADPMDGWSVPGPQPGSDPNPNDWIRTASVGFDEGAVASTADTLYFGFGFEGITDASKRADVMARSIGYLL